MNSLSDLMIICAAVAFLIVGVPIILGIVLNWNKVKN